MNEISLFDILETNETTEETKEPDFLEVLETIKVDPDEKYKKVLGDFYYRIQNLFLVMENSISAFRPLINKFLEIEETLKNQYDIITKSSFIYGLKELYQSRLNTISTVLKSDFKLNITLKNIIEKENDLIKILEILENYNIEHILNEIIEQIPKNLDENRKTEVLKDFKDRYFWSNKRNWKDEKETSNYEINKNKMILNKGLFRYYDEYSININRPNFDNFIDTFKYFDDINFNNIKTFRIFYHREEKATFYNIHEVNSPKIEKFKFYKNGKTEIYFKSEKFAKDFLNMFDL